MFADTPIIWTPHRHGTNQSEQFRFAYLFVSAVNKDVFAEDDYSVAC